MKKLVIVGGIVIVVVGIVLVLGISNLGPIIEKAVNTYGPRITKTDVHLGKVDLSIFSGQAELKAFSLGNPKGFNTPKAIEVGSIYVDVDEGSLTGDTVVIEKIAVKRPEITYEKARGTDNFRAILANVQQTVGGGKASGEATQGGGGGKKLMIREFLLEGGKVNLTMPLLAGKMVSTALPDIRLTNIGTEQEGVTPAAALEKVLAVLYDKIRSPAVTEQLNEGLKQLKEGAKALEEQAKKEVDAAKAAAQKELDAAQETAREKVQQETEKAKQGVEDIRGKVKGLLGN